MLCINLWPALFLHINKKDYVSITLAFLGWGIGVLVGFRDIPIQKEGYGYGYGYEDPLEYDLECDFDDDGSINYRDGMDYVDTWD